VHDPQNDPSNDPSEDPRALLERLANDPHVQQLRRSLLLDRLIGKIPAPPPPPTAEELQRGGVWMDLDRAAGGVWITWQAEDGSIAHRGWYARSAWSVADFEQIVEKLKMRDERMRRAHIRLA
jgi:hypothetical protein